MNPKFDIRSASAKDTYIAFMSNADREEAKKKGQISDEDIKRVGAPLTPEERGKLFSTISFLRILYLVSIASLGKTELELEGLQKNLKDLNEWIGKLNNAMAHATERNSKKDDKDRLFFLWDPKLESQGLSKTLRGLQERFGKDKIDIEIFFGREEGQGMNTKKGMPPNLAIEKLRNITTTLDNEVKTNSTQIQKTNSVYNTLLETLSFVSKKVTDAAQASLTKLG